MPEHVTAYQPGEKLMTLAVGGRPRLFEVRADGTLAETTPLTEAPQPRALTVDSVREQIEDYPACSGVLATTPHGTYLFDVVSVEDRDGVPVLRLQERTDA